MSARTLLEVLLKFWAVVTLASAASSVTGLISVFASPVQGLSRGQVYAYGSGFVFPVLAALALLRFARPLAGALTEHTAQDPLEAPGRSLLEASLITLGVFFVITGLRFIVPVAVELFLSQSWGNVGANESVWARNRSTFVSGITELVGGLLILRFRHRLPALFSASIESAA